MKTQTISLAICLALLPIFVQGEDAAQSESVKSEPNNAGVTTLDEAVDRRLSADSLQDLAEVASLVERAQREGLSGEYAEFAESLLASASLQRGVALGRSIIEVLGRLPSPPDGWEEQRDIAVAALRMGLARNTDEARAWLTLAQLQMLPGGDADDAKAALEHAVKGDDAEVRFHALLRKATLTEGIAEQGKLLDAAEEIAVAVGQENAPELLELKAKWLGSAERWDEATEVVKKLLDAAPDNPKVIDLAINILATGRRYDDALEVVAVMEKRLPDNPAVLLVKATILAAKNTEADTNAALGIFNKLREQNPTDPRFLLVRGQFHLEHKSLDLALRDAEAALRLKDDLGEAFLLKYRVLLLQKEYAAAEKTLDSITKLAGPSLALELERATLYSMSKQSRKALEIVDGLLDVAPDTLPVLQVKGQILISLGRHRDAAEVLTKVVELDDSQVVSINNLAWLLATSPDDDVRDGKRAIELATKAAEQTEYQEAFILSTLGAAYAETGDFESAIKWCDKCLQRAAEEGDDRIDEMRRERESYEKKEPFRERVEEE